MSVSCSHRLLVQMADRFFDDTVPPQAGVQMADAGQQSVVCKRNRQRQYQMFKLR